MRTPVIFSDLLYYLLKFGRICLSEILNAKIKIVVCNVGLEFNSILVGFIDISHKSNEKTTYKKIIC